MGSHHLPPYSILYTTPLRLHPNGSFSRDSQVGVPALWELISPDYGVWLQRGLNQSCSPRQDLSNAVSHFQFGGREEVDSRLLVVGSQIASLTPGSSFAHNLGCTCPNDQCEAILDIYTSRPFQWHQEHPNARCFALCCRTLNIRESWRTPNPQLWEWEFHPPTSPKVGLRHLTPNQKYLPYPTKESPSEGEGPKYISHHGSTSSHFPFVVTPNWCGEKWVHSQERS
jgi:hypothetical protein